MINSIKIFLLQRVSQAKTCSGFLILSKFKEKMLLSVIEKFNLGEKENISDAKSKMNVKNRRCFTKHEQN